MIRMSHCLGLKDNGSFLLFIFGDIFIKIRRERTYCDYSISFQALEYFRSDGKEYSVEDKD